MRRHSKAPFSATVALPQTVDHGGLRRRAGLLMALAALLCLLVPAAARALPAGYAYEKVTPAYKGNGEIGGTGLVLGLRASESGDRIVYSADGVFLGAPTFPQANAYYAHRTASGWQNSSVTARLPYLPFAAFDFNPEFPPAANVEPNGVSADGRWTLLGTDRDPATGERVPNRIYKVDLITGAVQRAGSDPLAGDPAVKIDPTSRSVVAGTADYGVVYFASKADLTPEAVGRPKNDEMLFRLVNGEVELASWLPDGEPHVGAPIETLPDQIGRNSVSADGSVYWFVGTSNFGDRRLFRGEAGVHASKIVNESENEAEAVVADYAEFKGASADGGRAVFTSSQKLLEGADGENAYLYTDGPDPENESNLTLISADGEPADDAEAATGIADVWDVSDDARTVYFSAQGQLVPGGPTGSGQKLYRWHDGDLSYLVTATIEPRAKIGSSRKPNLTTPDGRYLMFVSDSAGLTADDNGGHSQVYVYDAVEDQIECASCVPGGVNGGPATLEGSYNLMKITSQPRRWLSDDGRVFFQTSDRLVQDDTNGSGDVYTWKDGRAELISSGRNPVPPRFADASADGSTVFFITRERLTGWDTDETTDLYAARFGGGLPQPNQRPDTTCVGDACQGVPAAAPEPRALASADYNGPGQVRAGASCAALQHRAAAANRRARRAVAKSRRGTRALRRATGRRAQRLKRRQRLRVKRLRQRSQVLNRKLRACRSRAR